MLKKHNREYLEQLKRRYLKAKREEKQIILDEFTKTTGYERKHAGKLLRGKYRYVDHPIKRPRKKKYTLSDAVLLAQICDLLSWICSKRVQPQIEVAIESLVKAKMVSVSEEQKQKLIAISPATIDRLLKQHKKRPSGKGRSYTKPGTLLKTQIPIRTFADWNEDKVGFVEIDLVGHDGGVASGDFAWTLNIVDVKVQWTEQMAVKNKAQKHVFAALKKIRERLPFPLLGFDSDSGSEFINDQLYRYSIQERLTFTRGRAGKKNDNPFVEEKNDSVVRRWVGYGRFDSQEQVDVLNELYSVLRLYSNFFLPVQKLLKKERNDSKTKRIHDKAETPYQRILEVKEVPRMAKEKLKKQYGMLNLVDLKKQLDLLSQKLKPTKFR